MKVFVQEKYKTYIDANQFHIDLHFDQKTSYFSVVGDQQFIQPFLALQHPKSRILVCESAGVTAEALKILRPTHVVAGSHLEKLNSFLDVDRTQLEKTRHIQAIKVNVESKREELEKLNNFLVHQSDEKMVALKFFHQEENLKKNREKKLLYFLDFLNSEYERSDFLSTLLRYLWSEFKKMGPFYQMGIIIQDGPSENKVIVYDGRQEIIKSGLEFGDGPLDLAKALANMHKRPVGKIISWKSRQGQNTFCLFLETQGKEYDSVELESFISDRLNLISIVTHRWFIEIREKYLLDQWNKTFKAYKDPLHVVDEQFNLIQTNYAQLNSGELALHKCYQLLAGLEQPCLGCPLLVKNNLDSNVKVLIQGRNFRTLVSPFQLDKKYFFVFYEDTDDIDRLKSEVIQSEKMMTIGQLANHLAHELNNPLTGLKLYAQFLIQNGELNGNVTLQSDIQEILKAVERSETIIKDLIEFSVDIGPEQNVRTEEVVFDDVLKKTMTLLKSITRNHRLFIDLKRKKIKANSSYLQQVIFNLIKNSSQAIPEKGTIKIFEIESDQFIDYVIEDDGHGLPPEIIQHVFKPFLTTKKENEGTGLGLYISRTLMKRMDAELIYDSKFKQGARFLLRFKK